MVDMKMINAINLMSQGKEEGFNTFYTSTYDYVYKRAKYIMKNEEDALDLTQETFIQAYKGIDSLDNVSNVYAWLGAITYRQGMKIFRKSKEVLLNEDGEMIFDVLENEETNWMPEESVEVQTTKSIVAEFIEELPSVQKMAIMGFYFDNKKIEEIAEECDCSANTIKSRLNYAKKTLKEKVAAHEMQNRYKLCSVSPAILYMAFKALFAGEGYQVGTAAAQTLYNELCAEIGLQATTLVASITSAASDVMSATATTATTATTGTTGSITGATVASVATKAGMTIGVKIAIGVTALVVGTAAVIGGAIATGVFDKAEVEEVVEEEEIIEEEIIEEEIIEEEIIEESEEETVEESLPSIESQIQFIVENRDLWYDPELSVKSGENQYMVTDFDQNGLLEISEWKTDGTLLCTEVTLYEVDSTGSRLIEIGQDGTTGLGTIDLSDGESDVYYDAGQNIYYYYDIEVHPDFYSEEQLYIYEEMSFSFSNLYITHKLIGGWNGEWIGTVTETTDSSSEELTTTYFDGDENTCTQEELVQLREAYFSGMEKYTAYFSSYSDTGEMESMSDDELYTILMDSYAGFGISESTGETVEESDSQDWVTSLVEETGITEEELLAAYVWGSSDTGSRVFSISEYPEYFDIVEGKVIFTASPTTMMESPWSAAWAFEEGIDLVVYDIAEDCIFGVMSFTVDESGEFQDYLVDTYVVDPINEMFEYHGLSKESPEAGYGVMFEFVIENGVVVEIYNLIS